MHPKIIQHQINSERPFGLKLWKPALYPKHRSIHSKTWSSLHSMYYILTNSPGSLHPSSLQMLFCNMCWSVLLGWGYILFHYQHCPRISRYSSHSCSCYATISNIPQAETNLQSCFHPSAAQLVHPSPFRQIHCHSNKHVI